MSVSIMRRAEVLKKVGLCKATIQTLMDAGDFPKPVKLCGPDARAVGWVSVEVDAWIDQKIADRDTEIAGGAA